MSLLRAFVDKRSCKKSPVGFPHPSFSDFRRSDKETYSAFFIWYSKSKRLEAWLRNLSSAGL